MDKLAHRGGKTFKSYPEWETTTITGKTQKNGCGCQDLGRPMLAQRYRGVLESLGTCWYAINSKMIKNTYNSATKYITMLSFQEYVVLEWTAQYFDVSLLE